jgi:DNA recombination protein RmuC
MTILAVLCALACLALGYLWGRQSLLQRLAKAEAEALASLGNRDTLRAEFGELAGRLLEEKSGKLREEAGRHFEGVVAPLRQHLEDLKGLAQADSKDRAGLSQRVLDLVQRTADFNLKADQLSVTLKGNTKAQGTWGEVILARVLVASGLREGDEYVLQGRGLKLKSEDGRSQLPDAVILLPEGRQVVIDAKASPAPYYAWAEAREEAGQLAAAALLVASLRAHIKGLSEKDYTQLEGLRTPEFTLMFVPVEPALSVALQKEPTLFEQAWEKRVVVVGPNTLFGALKVIDQIWSQERRNKNSEEIAKRGGLLYDKLTLFIEDLGRAKTAMREALAAQDEAHKKLVDGRGNLVSQAEEMKRLGAKASKKLPKAWLDAAGEEDAPAEQNL